MPKKLKRFFFVYFFDLYCFFVFSALIPIKLRPFFLRLLGIDVSFSSYIRPGSQLHGKNISIGGHSVIAQGCYFDATGDIKIGERVHIGPGVSFVSVNHTIQRSVFRRKPDDATVQPIVIERGVWVGTNSIILPGVTVGEGVVIAAGSVVASDCEPNCLYAGVPARLKKTLDLL